MDAPAIRYATTAGGARVAFAARGEGQSIVLPPMTPWTLLPPRQVPDGTDIWELSEKAQLLAYDHVGTGLSQRTDFDFSLDAAVAELDAVVEASGLTDFVLLAVLYAGPLAIRYAVERPDHVRHLVLSATWAASREPAHRRLMLMGEALKEGDWEAASLTYAHLGWNLSGDEAEAVAENIRASIEPDVLLEYFTGVQQHDAGPLLPDISVPTTVMRRAEALTPMSRGASSYSDELVQHIPDAQLRLVDGGQWDWDTYAGFIDKTAPDRSDSRRSEERTRSHDQPHLTNQEIRVLRLIHAGRRNRQIADELVIAESTVANHVRNILAKTSTSTRTEAAAWAARNGLIED